MFESLHPFVIETILALLGLAASYFFKQLGDNKRVQKFAENDAILYRFIEAAVEAVEQKSKDHFVDNEEKYELVFDRTKSFVNKSLTKYNLDNKKITDEYIDTLIERAVRSVKNP